MGYLLFTYIIPKNYSILIDANLSKIFVYIKKSNKL